MQYSTVSDEYFERPFQENGEPFMLYDEPVDILVIEENDSKQTAIIRALEKSIPDIRVAVVHDGTEAQTFFFAHTFRVFSHDSDPPKLVLLDLGLPFSDSYSLIGQIRTRDKEGMFNTTPIVVFMDSEVIGDATDHLSLLREQLHYETAESPQYSDRCGNGCAMRDQLLPSAVLNGGTERIEK